MTHKPIPKAVRQKVYEKYHEHCAYCWCELEYKDMQVDYVDSLWLNSWKKKDTVQNDSMDLCLFNSGEFSIFAIGRA